MIVKMEKIQLSFAARQQNDSAIYIEAGAIGKIGSLLGLSDYSKIFVVTDQTVKPLLLDKLMAALPSESKFIVLSSGESEKRIESIQQIWTAMHSAGCDRKSLVINLGGGVIGDIGGFAASTYMRGVDFINVPTTLPPTLASIWASKVVGTFIKSTPRI